MQEAYLRGDWVFSRADHDDLNSGLLVDVGGSGSPHEGMEGGGIGSGDTLVAFEVQVARELAVPAKPPRLIHLNQESRNQTGRTCGTRWSYGLHHAILE